MNINSKIVVSIFLMLIGMVGSVTVLHYYYDEKLTIEKQKSLTGYFWVVGIIAILGCFVMWYVYYKGV